MWKNGLNSSYSPLHILYILQTINKLLCGRMEVTCDNCGKVIKRRPARVKSKKNHFCSRECMVGWQRKNGTKVEVKCDYCGKIIRKEPSEVNGVKRHFCSKACRHNWYCEHHEEYPTSTSIEVVCEYCGKTFLKQGSRLERTKRTFCSQDCYHLATRTRIKMVCANCGKEIEVYLSKLKINTNIFCSHECADAFNGKAQRGENHPNWQGGLTEQKYCYKFDNKLKEKVREKYGRQCLLCGKSEEGNGRKLCVHHVDYDKARGCNGKKWLLVPLCSSCHGKSEHSRNYWESLILTKMRKRKLSNSQTIIDAFAPLI